MDAASNLNPINFDSPVSQYDPVSPEQLRVILWRDKAKVQGIINTKDARAARLLTKLAQQPVIWYSEISKKSDQQFEKLSAATNRFLSQQVVQSADSMLRPALVCHQCNNGAVRDVCMALYFQTLGKRAPQIHHIPIEKQVHCPAAVEAPPPDATRAARQTDKGGWAQQAQGDRRRHKKTVFPRALRERLQELDIPTSIQRTLHAVLTHDEYPTQMGCWGTLVKNPIWSGLPVASWRRAAKDYAINGPSAPPVMHLDLLLLRGDDERGHGQVYTYYSKRWGYLLPFHQRMPGDPKSKRRAMAQDHLAHFLGIDAGNIVVKPLPEHFLVSLKCEPVSGNLILYVFEMCAVRLKGLTFANLKAVAQPRHGGDRRPNKWFYLQELRSRRREKKMNGDVVWALNHYFRVTLSKLPTSFTC